MFDFYCYGSVKLLVDGKEVKSLTNKHGSRPQAHGMRVEAGKSYDIEIRFQYFASDAQLNFDIGFKEECDIQRPVQKQWLRKYRDGKECLAVPWLRVRP